jgi:hypothetical protein
MSNMMNYVIAYPYPPEPHRLSIYTYGGDVQQQGTMQQAQWLLAYAKQRSPDHPWAIYRVEFTPVESVAASSVDEQIARAGERLAKLSERERSHLVLQGSYGPSHGIAK